MKLTLKQFVITFFTVLFTLFIACAMALYTHGHQSAALGLLVFFGVFVATVLAITGLPKKSARHGNSY